MQLITHTSATVAEKSSDCLILVLKVNAARTFEYSTSSAHDLQMYGPPHYQTLLTSPNVEVLIGALGSHDSGTDAIAHPPEVQNAIRVRILRILLWILSAKNIGLNELVSSNTVGWLLVRT